MLLAVRTVVGGKLDVANHGGGDLCRRWPVQAVPLRQRGAVERALSGPHANRDPGRDLSFICCRVWGVFSQRAFDDADCAGHRGDHGRLDRAGATGPGTGRCDAPGVMAPLGPVVAIGRRVYSRRRR